MYKYIYIYINIICIYVITCVHTYEEKHTYISLHIFRYVYENEYLCIDINVYV